ncbi:hypothetical protein, partial [Escherichia coli]
MHPENLRFWLKPSACPAVLRERFHQQCKCLFLSAVLLS